MAQMPMSTPPATSTRQPLPVATAEPLAGQWNVRVLGALEARNGQLALTHFVSQPIAALLARLALAPDRHHAREELVEHLWPGVELDVGRNRLRNAISSLRRMLEPPGVGAGAVLVADRQSVRLAAGACTCDALEFERAVRAGHTEQARSLYRGELLPGFYDDWVQDERARLAALFDRVAEADARAGQPAAPRTDAPSAAATKWPGGQIEPSAPWPQASPVLPSYLTTFFARSAEREQLRDLSAQHRLVTLHGTGGCGKTRLAVEVARAAKGFDCVAFAALADCRDAAQMATQLHVALALPRAPGDPLEQVIAMLRGQRALLVLDNFEQLVQAGGVNVVEALLAGAAQLHVLVTTRRVLGLAGEHELALQPLPQPEPHGSVEQVARSPSVSLFVDRARSVRPDFQVTARNHEALATLCRALEGLPLAIELAASRSRAFSPGDMHAALAQRFSLLARGAARGAGAGSSANASANASANGSARHDSLRAAIDWSWQLLTQSQQRFLMALSVFRGGSSAQGAQAISDEPNAHAVLEELTADSLLTSDADASGSMRFFMLEMIREFLHEQLLPADAQRLRQRHRAHFLACALTLGRRSQAAPRDELPNFIEAVQTAVDDTEPLLALALGVALRGEWEQHGMPVQVRSLMERALLQHGGGAPAAPVSIADAGGSEALLVHAHLVLRAALLVAGESEAAQTHATRALALAGQQPALRAAALLAQARQHWERSRGDAGMRPLLDEALALARQECAVELEAGVTALLATMAFHLDGKSDEAIALFGCAQQLYEAAGIEHHANRMLFTKANCHAKLHRYETAMLLLAECERRFIAAGDVAALPELANVQGFLFAYMVRWRDAEQAFARCAVGSARLQNRYMMGFGLWNLARPIAHRRQPELAARLMAYSARYWTANFSALIDSDLRYVEQVRRLIRVQIGPAATERAWASAATMTLTEALDLAAHSLQPPA